MGLIGAAAALALAVVLAWAAISKLRRPVVTAADMAGLGLPYAPALAWIVPVVELVVAGALLTVPGWGGVVAFALLAAFTALLASVVRSGRAVPCACFGGTSRQPVSSRHLVRNAVLLGLAALAATVDGGLWSAVD